MVRLTGALTCADRGQAARVARYLPEHVALSRGEPGCLRFGVVQIGPLVWQVDETSVDAAAFEAQQGRMRRFVWFRVTGDVARAFHETEGERAGGGPRPAGAFSPSGGCGS